MRSPLALMRDATSEAWHMTHYGQSVCGDDVADLEWHLPDEPSLEIKLCLDCWERVAVAYDLLQSPPRFIRKPEEDEQPAHVDWPTRAWLDTERDQIILVPATKTPNDYIRHSEMYLLYTDQQEYYVVCRSCRQVYGDHQWSGSTRGAPDWRKRAEKYRHEHVKTKGWCQFCDRVFGNGGWRLD